MLKALVGAALVCAATAANAYTDNKPLTFSVEVDSDYPFCCTVSPGVVLVGAAYSDLYIRGMAEFNLLGNLGYRGEPVYLSFTYLSNYAPQFSPFASPINISAYFGDNIAARPDYSVATFAGVGNFQTAGLALGSTLTYDVTSLFQYATRAGAPALGFRLGLNGGQTSGAARGAYFGNFALSAVPPVPEPSTYALMLAGLTAVGVAFRRRRAQQFD